MKQSLQLKVGHQLTMTPQLQQAIRLLQLSTLDLQAEIQEALDSNPLLEVTEQSEQESSDAKENKNENTESNDNTNLDTQSTTSETANEDAISDDNTAEGDWSENIPTDLAVDTSWDDVYQSSAPPSSSSRAESDDFD